MQKNFSKLNSGAAKLAAIKDQIRIRVIGFGWKDLHHPWSKNGVDYTPEELLHHLIDSIIPQQKHRLLTNESSFTKEDEAVGNKNFRH